MLTELKTMIGIRARKRHRPGLGDLAYAIAEVARSPAGRAELRSIFASHIGSSNRASLSLLSMPKAMGDMEGHWGKTLDPMWWSHGEPAWVNTGDAELLAANDLHDWAKHYRSELGQVRALVLPHHGSDHNSNQALQNLCAEAALLAPVKSGAKKHPGKGVAAAASKRLICVTEHGCTEFSLHYFWP